MPSSADAIGAVRRGNLDELKSLIDAFSTTSDLDINYVTPADGRSALHYAALAANLECLNLLLREPSVVIDLPDLDGNTPLHLAATSGEVQAVTMLIDAGGNPFSKNKTGGRPCDSAKTKDIESFLMTHMSTVSNDGVNTSLKNKQIKQLENELPENTQILKAFIIDLVITNNMFQDRCRETIHQLIEEKHTALHKNRLLETAAGIQDKETGNRFIDQLQYLQDENEKQSATISYLKKRIAMLESAAGHQEDFYRRNLADLQKQHTEQLQAIYSRTEEAERQFLEYQKKQSVETAELNRLRGELAALKGIKGGSNKIDFTAGNVELIAQLQVEINELRSQVAQINAEKEIADERLKRSENLRVATEREVQGLRNGMTNRIMASETDDAIKKIYEKRSEQDEKDEAMGLVLFVKDDSGNKQVKAATREKLVERMIDPANVETSFIPTLILTFKSFMSSSLMLNEIIKRYNSEPAKGEDASIQAAIQQRIGKVLKHWIEDYWASDFANEPETVDKLTSFVETIKQEEIKSTLKAAISKQVSPDSSAVVQRNFAAAAPKPIIPKPLQKRYAMLENLASPGIRASFLAPRKAATDEEIKLKFMDIDPAEFARQMTIIEFDLFMAVKSREFLDLAWMKDDKEVRAPNICKMTKFSNHVVHWLVSEIVSIKDNVKNRAAVMERIIMIAHHLEKLNNFNGVKEVLAALQSSSVYRLKKMKELIPSKQMKIYQDLIKMTSSELNYKNLRGKVHAVEPPLLPFPGVYQGDLVFLDTCAKSIIDKEKGIINYSKYQKIASYILELQAYQQTMYNLEPVLEIQEYVRTFPTFDDDQAYAASLVCEPRQ